jgi:hypothetical protein
MTMSKDAIKVCEDDRQCVQFVHEGGVVRIDVWLSLQQRKSIRLRNEQINELIDWLVDRYPNGLSEPKEG